VRRPALLDVDVLIALFDPDHVHHDAAHAWFGNHRASGWATCPLTENAAVRILSNPAYGAFAAQPIEPARRVAAFRDSGHHTFWPDDVSLCDTGVFDLVVGHRLATFDRSIPLKAVRGARPSDLLVLEA
jgi:predicted nucleic acid-binding protein